jgi:nitrite reductase/ring-hydroxylating ferredoxin subunit
MKACGPFIVRFTGFLLTGLAVAGSIPRISGAAPQCRHARRAVFARFAVKITHMSNDKLLQLCDASEVAPGCAFRAEALGCVYAVYNVEGNYYVSQDECTHGPGYLSEGFILDDEIECPFHQGRFHIPSGRATCAPATEALRIWKVNLVDGKVCIDPAEHE